ncbi:ABC transporter permease subunit [Phytohabitans rumicis]|uniref:ABC transporter permease n=1 Tax=Phytohabitans rumicis TaxID=1076125 RepID=A0A6V8L975_9ACTN|nr:ABC transporter permease subunit [Phytohabitans rumicis]GFJ89255.1 hypothetical protein Prum_028970 [Phytohabitans rumicis]
MNLVAAELSRLTARRFVQLMLVLLIGAGAVTVGTTLATSHRPTAIEWDQAEQQAQVERNRIADTLADCQRAELDEEYCRQLAERDPRAEDYLYGVFVFKDEIKGLVYFLISFLALFGFLVAASFIGAELTSGGMTNLLLWRPQRMTVLGTKLGTMLGAVLAVSVAATVLYVGAFWTIAEATGVRGDLDADFWSDLGLTLVRGLAFVLFVSAVAFGAATLGRHTAAAVGLIAAYAIVWEIGLRIVLEVTEAGRPDQWVLSSYIGAWMDGRLEFWDSNACRGFGPCEGTYELTWVHASAVFAVILIALVGGAFATFRQRDLA